MHLFHYKNKTATSIRFYFTNVSTAIEWRVKCYVYDVRTYPLDYNSQTESIKLMLTSGGGSSSSYCFQLPSCKSRSYFVSHSSRQSMHANSTCECVFCVLTVLCSQSLWDEYWGMLCVLVGLCDCIVSEKGKPVSGKQHMAHNAHKPTTTTTHKRHKQQQPHHIIIINIINAYDMQLHSCANSLTQHRQSMTTLRRLSFIAYRINVDEKIIGCHTHNEAMPIFSQRRGTYWMKNKWIELFISRKVITRCGHWTHTHTHKLRADHTHVEYWCGHYHYTIY